MCLDNIIYGHERLREGGSINFYGDQVGGIYTRAA